MKAYFAYIRVSTVKQGERGSSLQEQRDAIGAFATRNNLRIATWFEERETAAKLGRREFTRMIGALHKRKALGVIFHKIDRSARNLRDWSAIQDLADEGIDIRFTQESVNLGSNEGKLTGDFLAVISAHYIRNLREEVKKGMRGRFKQGLFPLAAPIGYLDQGGGKAKIPDPIRAPFVRQAFELYASGSFSQRILCEHLYRAGFRNRSGNKVTKNRISDILRNPFYVGIIKLKRSGETYPGIHEPLIGAELFERVQARLDGKLNAKVQTHDFIFRRLLRCARCGYHLIAERQKGHVYYRCHNCPGYCVREEVIQTALFAHLAPLTLRTEEADDLRDLTASLTDTWEAQRQQMLSAIKLQIDATTSRRARLTDIYVEGAIDRPLFEEKKLASLLEQKSLEEQRDRIVASEGMLTSKVSEYLELVKMLPLSYGLGNYEEKRLLLKSVTSNLIVDGKNVVVKLKSPFFEIATADLALTSGPVRDRPRTKAQRIFEILTKHFTAHPNERQQEEVVFADAA
jgi:site-specific DNA recombinase